MTGGELFVGDLGSESDRHYFVLVSDTAEMTVTPEPGVDEDALANELASM